MIDFNTLLNDARQLAPEDRVRLIDALWDSLPADMDLPLHADWEAELEKRVAAIQAGTARTVPWSQIRDEALARIGHGNER